MHARGAQTARRATTDAARPAHEALCQYLERLAATDQPRDCDMLVQGLLQSSLEQSLPKRLRKAAGIGLSPPAQHDRREIALSEVGPQLAPAEPEGGDQLVNASVLAHR